MASESGQSTWRTRVDGDGLEEISGRLVSGGFFEVLGVRAAIGRLFTTDDDRQATPSLVLSHGYWQRRFGGRPDVLGRTIVLRKTAFTIIGVAARGFVGETAGQQPDVWLPLRLQPIVLPGRDRLHDTPPEKTMWLHVFGRLTPGVTPAQAEARANAIFQAGLESFYGAEAQGERRRELLNQRLQVRPGGRGASPTRRQFSQSLTALLTAVGVLLLIACANLANLLLARGTARRPEIAVRLSLGASRGRVVRQLVTESLALALLGGVAAIVVAFVLHEALVRMIVETDERFRLAFALDPLILGFLVAATLGASLLFGVWPAWRVTRGDIVGSLKAQGRSAGAGSGQLGPGRLLVALQVALSLPLLFGAGLLVRTAYNVQHANLGFPADHLLLARVDLREPAYDAARRLAVLSAATAEIARLPGVRAVSYSQLGIFSGGESSSTIAIDGYTPTGIDDRDSAVDAVGPGYFAAIGVPIVLGRGILDSDRASSPRVCVVNETFARQYFGGRNPIGMRVTRSLEDDGVSYQIVGVAGDARTQSLRGSIEHRFFVAAAQVPSTTTGPTLLLRTAGDTAALLATVQQTMQRIDPAVPVVSAVSLAEQMAPLTAQDRATARLAAVFGLVALALAAIGLYGVLSYAVARRTAEIAIRLALGAPATRVLAAVLAEALALVGAGLAAGAGLSAAGSRLIDSRLYGVTPQDPLSVAAAAGVLLLAAGTAAYLPARRASKVDPMTALRQV
jgi:putative ABC transport system permease protein